MFVSDCRVVGAAIVGMTSRMMVGRFSTPIAT